MRNNFFDDRPDDVPAGWRETAERVQRLWHGGNQGLVEAGMELALLKRTLVPVKGSASAADITAGYVEWRRFWQSVLRWPQHQVERTLRVGAAFGAHLDWVGCF